MFLSIFPVVLCVSLMLNRSIRTRIIQIPSEIDIAHREDGSENQKCKEKTSDAKKYKTKYTKITRNESKQEQTKKRQKTKTIAQISCSLLDERILQQ